MKRLIAVLMSIGLVFAFAPIADAHPGKLDKNGGHYCRTNCAKWGLKDGEYHYHNGGGSSTTTKPSTSKPKPSAPKPVPQKKEPAVREVSVYINGIKQSYNQNAYVKNGTTLVPMRGIFESLGAGVQWESATQKVTGKKGNTTITLNVGNKKVYVSEKASTKSISLDQPSEVRNGSTMVPLRVISESLGASVQWDSANNAVKINN